MWKIGWGIVCIVMTTNSICAQQLFFIGPGSLTELEEYAFDGRLSDQSYLDFLQATYAQAEVAGAYLMPLGFIAAPDQSYPVEQGDSKLSFLATYQTRPDAINENRRRFRVDAALTRNWSVQADYGNDYAERSRWRRRSVRYTSLSGLLQSITLGSFTHRIGLGAIFGYRRSPLVVDDPSFEESIISPESGSNGLLLTGTIGSFKGVGLGSVIRNDQHRLSTAAFSFERTMPFGQLEGGITLTQLRNRKTDRSEQLWGVSQTIRFGQSGTGDEAAFEGAAQFRDGQRTAALVCESQHAHGDLAVRLDGWWYDSNWHDLTSGSLSASIARTAYLEGVELNYENKRSGQLGGRLTFDIRSSAPLIYKGAVLAGGHSSDSFNLDLWGGVTRRFEAGDEVSFAYLLRERRRGSDPDPDDPSSQEIVCRWLATRSEAAQQFTIWMSAAIDLDRNEEPLSIEAQLSRTVRTVKIVIRSRISRISDSRVGVWWAKLSSEWTVASRLVLTVSGRLAQRALFVSGESGQLLTTNQHTLECSLAGRL